MERWELGLGNQAELEVGHPVFEGVRPGATGLCRGSVLCRQRHIAEVG